MSRRGGMRLGPLVIAPVISLRGGLQALRALVLTALVIIVLLRFLWQQLPGFVQTVLPIAIFCGVFAWLLRHPRVASLTTGRGGTITLPEQSRGPAALPSRWLSEEGIPHVGMGYHNDGWHVRPVGEPYWVYVYKEWRDQYGRVLPRFGMKPAGAILHTVYVGKANEVEDRYKQHMWDKKWAHPHLIVETYAFSTEEDALAFEAYEIARRAVLPNLYDRPRENRQLNPTYNPQHCQEMAARAFPTS